QKTEPEIKEGAKEIGNSVLNLTGMDSLDLRVARKIGKALDDTLGQSKDAPFTSVLTLITKTYKEIVNTNFRFSYNVNVSPDISELKLQVFPRKDSTIVASDNDTLTRYFPIKSGSNLRLRNSVGVS